MKKKIEIQNGAVSIPAILWGAPSQNILIEIHGNMSNKEDDVIEALAIKATRNGYQVISFDLPEHGERAGEPYACTPVNCISDLQAIYSFALSLGSEISIFACSLGVYFSLLAYKAYDLKHSLFLSPIVNMERLLQGMMAGFDISEERLRTEKQIKLPIGETLDWDYYTFVRENPISFNWNTPTHMLYGSKDQICDWTELTEFEEKHGATLKVDEYGEHYYHTKEQLDTVGQWTEEVLFK